MSRDTVIVIKVDDTKLKKDVGKQRKSKERLKKILTSVVGSDTLVISVVRSKECIEGFGDEGTRITNDENGVREMKREESEEREKRDRQMMSGETVNERDTRLAKLSNFPSLYLFYSSSARIHTFAVLQKPTRASHDLRHI